MRTFTLIAALIIAGSLPAQDGALEINQACVEDGCFDGHTGGFPVWINNDGLYRLTSDLVVPDTVDKDAISVNNGPKNRVTIDLNGFSITGPNSCSGKPVTGCTGSNSHSGIDASGSATVRVQDGHVVGFEIGVRCESGPCELENLTVAHNSSHGAIQTFAGNPHRMVIRNSNFTSNGDEPLASGGIGTMVVGSIFKWNKDGPGMARGAFLNNVVWNNGGPSYFGAKTLVSRNTFSRNDIGSGGSGDGISAGDNACNGSIC